MENDTKFMMAVLALGLIATLEGEEKPKSALANRCGSAHESILRVCDIYLPEGLESTDLSRIWQVLDGPVLEVIRQNQHAIYGALPQEVRLAA